AVCVPALATTTAKSKIDQTLLATTVGQKSQPTFVLFDAASAHVSGSPVDPPVPDPPVLDPPMPVVALVLVSAMLVLVLVSAVLGPTPPMPVVLVVEVDATALAEWAADAACPPPAPADDAEEAPPLAPTIFPPEQAA